MKKLSTFFVLAVALLAAVMLSHSASARTVKGTGYTVEIPEDWEILPKQPGSRVDVMAVSPLENAEDGFRESLNVMRDQLPAGMSKEDWLAMNRAQLQQMGAQILEDFVPVKIGDMEGYHTRFLLTVQGFDCDDDSYAFFKGRTVYVISCVALADTRAAYQGPMGEIIESLTVVPERPAPENQPVTYEGEGYSVHFSADWTVSTEVAAQGADVVGLLPPQSIGGKLFRPNLNVRRDPLPAGMTPQAYLELNTDQLTKIGATFSHGFEPAQVGNTEGYHTRFALNIQGIAFDDDCYVVIKDGFVYTLTCTNGAGDMRAQTFPKMEVVIASFKLTE
jgi:hypothetical protein